MGSGGQFIVTDFRTGKGTVRGPYSQDGKDHRLSRRRCHYCVCSDLLAILADRAQMTPKALGTQPDRERREQVTPPQ
jgi:hypothetical protein